MWFNSVDFAIFFLTVFFVYWFALKHSRNLQNVFLLIASYFFYAYWDWRFLSLIAFSSTIDYFVGLQMHKSDSKQRRKLLIIISLVVNIGLLGFFKYFNFFIDSFVDLSNTLGFQANRSSLNIILPVGISFYTFQTLSYTIDIYRKKLEPTQDVIAFFLFVSFFPQLVAGPIERAYNLLPQFLRNRKFEYEIAKDGIRLVLWGLFKKVVIADNCALHVNDIFLNYDTQDGSVLLLGAFLFAIQIYGDFSGYSDIAIGAARMLGFNLMRNFAYPYFSRDIGEFWRRWHISLSTWFRDYVFIPIGGNRVSKAKYIRNILITFTISGLWHGANWTFVIWGFLNGLYYLPLILVSNPTKYKNIVAHNSWLPSIKEIFQIGTTFFLTLVAWIFFRAESLSHALGYLGNMFDRSLLNFPSNHLSFMPMVIIFLIIEWVQRCKVHGLELNEYPQVIRVLAYATITILIVMYHIREVDIEFIYFQF